MQSGLAALWAAGHMALPVVLLTVGPAFLMSVPMAVPNPCQALGALGQMAVDRQYPALPRSGGARDKQQVVPRSWLSQGHASGAGQPE